MKTKKYEIARAIDKLKSVVQKNEVKPALSGILVKNGRLIASNSEITIHIRFEASAGENFLIPMKAFDLIRNLPDGDMEISADENNIVTIKMDKIKNSYQSYPAGEFIFQDIPVEEENGLILPGEKLISAICHVIYAAADNGVNGTMNGICMESDKEQLNIVALDGHVLAWDKIDVGQENNMKIIVPKTAAKKLVDMGMEDDVKVSFDKNHATFRTDEYVIYSRLIEGNYFPYATMFKAYPTYTIVNRKELSDCMTRAKMCVRDEAPTVFEISGEELKVSLKDRMTDYEENIQMRKRVEHPIKIGFSSKLVLETIKAFTSDNITLNFESGVTPMVVEAENSAMKAMVLPVKIRG